MADTPDTPEETTEANKPAPARRRAPRKTPATPRKAPASRAAASKSTVEKAEEAVQSAATTTTRRVKAGVAKAEETVASAAKAVKPRSTKRTTPRSGSTRKKQAKQSTFSKATDKVGGKWGAAAIAGGLAAAGAAAAALLSLKGSTPKAGQPSTPTPDKGAHQPDGTDASKSFQAGIADENTVPNS